MKLDLKDPSYDNLKYIVIAEVERRTKEISERPPPKKNSTRNSIAKSRSKSI